MKSRGQGKTTEAIIWCKLNNWTLVTMRPEFIEYLCYHVLGFKESIQTMSYSTFKTYTMDYRGSNKKLKVMIDDVSCFLQYMTDSEIMGYTDSIDNNEKF